MKKNPRKTVPCPHCKKPINAGQLLVALRKNPGTNGGRPIDPNSKRQRKLRGEL